MTGWQVGRFVLGSMVALLWYSGAWAAGQTSAAHSSTIRHKHGAQTAHPLAHKSTQVVKQIKPPAKGGSKAKKSHFDKKTKISVEKTRKSPHYHVKAHSHRHVLQAHKSSPDTEAVKKAETAQEKMPAVPPGPALIDPHKGSVTGMPMPRFASLRADEVNWRAGPGSRYPIQWVYHRRGMPVQIIREFDVWRLISDVDGNKGWVHQATLVGRRSFIVPGVSGIAKDQQEEKSGKATTITGKADTRIEGYITDISSVRQVPGSVIMRAQANENSAVVALLKPGSIGWLEHCEGGGNWCQVKVQQYQGWLPRKVFWGLMPDEVIQ